MQYSLQYSYLIVPFYAGTHVALALSYLYPAALFRASLVVFMMSHHLPFLSVA